LDRNAAGTHAAKVQDARLARAGDQQRQQSVLVIGATERDELVKLRQESLQAMAQEKPAT